MAVKCKEYGQSRGLYQQMRTSRFTLKVTRNSYYYTVQRDKQKCWKDFLQGAEGVQNIATAGAETRTSTGGQQLGDTERCWMALRYTRPWISSTTPALKVMGGNQATTVEDKEVMVRRVAFPRPPDDSVCYFPSRPSTAHQDIDRETVQQAL